MKKKYLVEVWEHRQVSFEVEAENEEEAKATAEDVYANSDRLQDIMVNDDESIASEEVNVITCLGEADGIIGNNGERKGE